MSEKTLELDPGEIRTRNKERINKCKKCIRKNGIKKERQETRKRF